MAESSAEPRVVVIDKDGDTILILIGPIQELKDFDSDRDSDTDGATETDSDTYSDNDSNSYCVSEVVPAAEAKRVFERHYQVSSLLLKQASKYFRNMFSGGFSETFPCPDDGKYHIVAKSFHPFALEKVLDIVHLKNLGLQNKIGQEGLAHVAVVVDYYDMYEAVATQTKIWASVTAKDSFLEMFCFDTLVRTFVLKIFGDAKDFEEGAKCVVQTSKGPIPDVGIPMLGVAELLDDHRLRAIQAMVGKIKEVPRPGSTEYWSHSAFTRDMLDKCDSIRTSEQRIHEIKPPYWDVSYQDLKWKVSKFIDIPDDNFTTVDSGLTEYEMITLWGLKSAWDEKEYRPQNLLLDGIERAASIAWDYTIADINLSLEPANLRAYGSMDAEGS